uniref:Uncharacterized protein n=1 Tax=Aotus nancymaae TaxID=37293 RepID=A0A2K5F6Y6_AOTNA
SAWACPCQVPRASSSTWVPCQMCGPRERHGPRTPGGQLPGARRGPGPRRPAPLPAAACDVSPPAATRRTAAWPRGLGGSPQPPPRPAPGREGPEARRNWRRPGGPGGRSHPGGPGSPRGGGAVGPGDRGPAAADGGRPQRAVRAAETRGAAAAPPLTLEGPVQSHHGTPALSQGPQSPRDGAQLGACTRPVDVRDSGGRPLPPPDTLASAGDFLCTM